jgi:hypothetical protein
MTLSMSLLFSPRCTPHYHSPTTQISHNPPKPPPTPPLLLSVGDPSSPPSNPTTMVHQDTMNSFSPNTPSRPTTIAPISSSIHLPLTISSSEYPHTKPINFYSIMIAILIEHYPTTTIATTITNARFSIIVY